MTENIAPCWDPHRVVTKIDDANWVGVGCSAGECGTGRSGPHTTKENLMRRRGIVLSASALAFTTATALAGHARADEPALAPPPNPPPPATATANGDAHG